MRIQAFRIWFASTLHQGVGAARRAGLAITRRIRQATGKIDVSVGVGDDESRFGGSGSRAWLEILEQARGRLLVLFEKSTFERFPRFERFMRRLLGSSPAPERSAPKLDARAAKEKPMLGAHGATRTTSEEDARLRAQVRLGMMQAHTREHAGLRDRAAGHRRSSAEDEAENEDREDADRGTDDRNEDRREEERGVRAPERGELGDDAS